MLIREIQIHRASGEHAQNHGLSTACHRFQELSLGFRKLQIRLVAGGVAVPGISFFSLQSFIQSKAEHHHVAVFRDRERFRDAVLSPGKSFYAVLIQMAALRIKHAHLLTHRILNALKHGDIAG